MDQMPGKSPVTVQRARQFLAGLALPKPEIEPVEPHHFTPKIGALAKVRNALVGGEPAGNGRTTVPSIAQPAGTPDQLAVQAGVSQAFLVGPQIVSFNEDVTPELRSAALNSFNLASSAARAKFPQGDESGAINRRESVVTTLLNLGWVAQDDHGDDIKQHIGNVSVDKEIIAIAEAAIGGGIVTTIIKQVLDTMTGASKDDPFIVLYNSRTITRSVNDFSISVGSGSDTGFLLNLLYYELYVADKHSQVLFFKWDATDVQLSCKSYKLSLSMNIYSQIKPTIEKLLVDQSQAYLLDLAGALAGH